MKISQNSLWMTAALLLTTYGLFGCKPQQPAANEAGAVQTATQPAESGAPAKMSNPGTGASQTATVYQPAAANQPAAAQAAAPATPVAPPPPPKPVTFVLAAGTPISVRLDTHLSSKISQTGDRFTATVSQPVEVNGVTVIAKGAEADGTVTDAQSLGRVKGEARLGLKLERIETRWGAYSMSTSAFEQTEKGKGKRSTAMIGGGAALGALIGGLTGGGKGAAIGGLAGAGAGTAGATLTGNQQIELPAETLLTFRLQQAVTVTEKK